MHKAFHLECRSHPAFTRERLLNKRKKGVMWTLGLLIGISLIFIVYPYWETNRVVINETILSFSDLPKEFDGYRILQVTDVHAKSFGERQSKILNKIHMPLFGALYAPGGGDGTGGFFPKYSKGVYHENDRTLFVSSGLGIGGDYSLLRFRFFNPPEVNILTLNKE